MENVWIPDNRFFAKFNGTSAMQIISLLKLITAFTSFKKSHPSIILTFKLFTIKKTVEISSI